MLTIVVGIVFLASQRISLPPGTDADALNRKKKLFPHRPLTEFLKRLLLMFNILRHMQV
jgi:hypothetical protein